MAPAATQPTTIPAIAPPPIPELDELDESVLPMGVGVGAGDFDPEAVVGGEIVVVMLTVARRDGVLVYMLYYQGTVKYLQGDEVVVARYCAGSVR
jgi:hypothetical protein